MVAPGIFEWTSPHGHRYRRDRTGTTRIDELASHPTDHDPAPHPATHEMAGPQACPSGAINAALVRRRDDHRGLRRATPSARRAVHLGVVQGIGVAVDAHQLDEPRLEPWPGAATVRLVGPARRCGWRDACSADGRYPVRRIRRAAVGRHACREVLDPASACASRPARVRGFSYVRPTAAAVTPAPGTGPLGLRGLVRRTTVVTSRGPTTRRISPVRRRYVTESNHSAGDRRPTLRCPAACPAQTQHRAICGRGRFGEPRVAGARAGPRGASPALAVPQ